VAVCSILVAEGNSAACDKHSSLLFKSAQFVENKFYNKSRKQH
jgi:hypothetical protein